MPCSARALNKPLKCIQLSKHIAFGSLAALGEPGLTLSLFSTGFSTHSFLKSSLSVCTLYVKSCKLHAGQQNILCATAEHISFYLVGLSVSAKGACFYRRKPCSFFKSSLCVPCAVTHYKTTLANNLMQQQPEMKVMHH